MDSETGAVRALNTWTDSIASRSEYGPQGEATQYNLHRDGIGSIRALTGENESEKIDRSIDYTAFGSSIGDDAACSLTTYAFTGQLRDPATGLQYHRARWLDPHIASWLSVDAAFDFEINHGSPYHYAGSNPLSVVDLNGKAGSLVEQLVVVANIIDLVSTGLQLAMWINNAAGIIPVSEATKDRIDNIFFYVDMATLPFGFIKSGAKKTIKQGVGSGPLYKNALINEGGGFFARFSQKIVDGLATATKNGKKQITKAKVLREIGKLEKLFGPKGRYAQIGARGFDEAVDTWHALTYLRHLHRIPFQYWKYAVAAQKTVMNARSLIALKKWDELRLAYGELDEVQRLFRIIREGKGRGHFFEASGNAIHAIVRKELELLKPRNPEFHKLILESSHKGIAGVPDIAIDGKWIMDITTTKQAGKALKKYGKQAKKLGGNAMDILYESFNGDEIRHIMGAPKP